MRAAILLAALALSGCSTIRYQRVYCLTPAELQQLKDAKPGKIKDRLNGQADHDIKPIAGRLIRVEAYADGLLTVLGGCTNPN